MSKIVFVLLVFLKSQLLLRKNYQAVLVTWVNV